MLKKYALLVSICYSFILTAASLLKVNSVTDKFPANSDKVFHASAYCLFTILWFLTFYYKLGLKKAKALSLSVLLAITFGILIEVLQGVLTSNRQMELNDVIANTIGALIAAVVILSLKKGLLKNNNSLHF